MHKCRKPLYVFFGMLFVFLIGEVSLRSVLAAEGSLKWKFQTNSFIWSSPAIGGDSTIYVGSSDGNLYAVNPNGTKKWAFDLGWGNIASASPCIDDNETIYICCGDGNLYAINPNGTKKWSLSIGCSGYNRGVAFGKDGTIYASGDCLYAINPNGTQKWKYCFPYGAFSSPTVSGDGTVYIGRYHSLYAINPDSTLKWEYEALGLVREATAAIGSDGTVYFGSDDSNLYALNPDGTFRWKFTTGWCVNYPPVIGPDGTIYVSSGDSKFYAINPDGTQKWVFSEVVGFPSAAIGHDSNIYIGGGNKFFCIKPNGTKKWEYEADGGMGTCPVIGDDGTIYVGCSDNNLYAIESTAGGLAETPWPMFHHDVRHSGGNDALPPSSQKTFRCSAENFKGAIGKHGGQCVPYVRYETGIPIYGDAHTWYYKAKSLGYATGDAERKSAIVVFKKGALPYGHVGIIKSIDADNKITIRDSNWCSNNCEIISEDQFNVVSSTQLQSGSKTYDLWGYIYCNVSVSYEVVNFHAKNEGSEITVKEQIDKNTQLTPSGNIIVRVINYIKGVIFGQDSTQQIPRAASSTLNSCTFTFSNAVLNITAYLADFSGNTTLTAYDTNHNILKTVNIQGSEPIEYTISGVGQIKEVVICSDSGWLGYIIYQNANTTFPAIWLLLMKTQSLQAQ